MVNEQFPYFTGMTRKQLPSFGDEILTLLFNFAFNSLNDSLFICVFALIMLAVSYTVVIPAESRPKLVAQCFGLSENEFVINVCKGVNVSTCSVI